jgi:hypothetical protein
LGADGNLALAPALLKIIDLNDSFFLCIAIPMKASGHHLAEDWVALKK